MIKDGNKLTIGYDQPSFLCIFNMFLLVYF